MVVEEGEVEEAESLQASVAAVVEVVVAVEAVEAVVAVEAVEAVEAVVVAGNKLIPTHSSWTRADEDEGFVTTLLVFALGAAFGSLL